MKKKIIIQIPCLNEQSTIGKVIKDLKKVLKNAEIVVYDNFSTDNTVKEAKTHGAKAFRARTVIIVLARFRGLRHFISG